METLSLSQNDEEQIRKIKVSRYDTWEWNFGASPNYDIEKKHYIDGFGSIEIHMNVNNGVITDFATFGDYFGSGNMTDVAPKFENCRLTKEDILTVLRSFAFDHYYYGISVQKMADIIVD